MEHYKTQWCEILCGSQSKTTSSSFKSKLLWDLPGSGQRDCAMWLTRLLLHFMGEDGATSMTVILLEKAPSECQYWELCHNEAGKGNLCSLLGKKLSFIEHCSDLFSQLTQLSESLKPRIIFVKNTQSCLWLILDSCWIFICARTFPLYFPK